MSSNDDLPVPADEEPEGRVSRCGPGEGTTDPETVRARYEKNADGDVATFSISWTDSEYGRKCWIRCAVEDVIHTHQYE